MYRKKNFVSLGISLILAAGITVTPVTAADFTDGTVSGFNSEDTAEFGTQQETSDEEEITSQKKVFLRKLLRNQVQTKRIRMKQKFLQKK